MGNETCYIVQFLVKCAKIYHIKTNYITIKGVLHLLPKISMFFFLYVKIINNFLKNELFIYKKCSRDSLKNGTEILVGQAVFKLQIKTVKMLFLDQ